MLDGDWDALEGQYFEEFRRDKHVCDPFDIPVEWKRFRSMDWGFNDPTAVYWYALAPEGTRKRVERWKTGFWKIAHEAQVPILPAYFHYPDKRIGVGPLFATTGDMAADIAALRAWYRPWIGRNRGTA